MRRFAASILLIGAALFAAPACAQIGGGGVQQTGAVVANNGACWDRNGVIKDCGLAPGAGNVTTGGSAAAGQIAYFTTATNIEGRTGFPVVLDTQTGTTYTVPAADQSALLTLNNAASIAVTQPQATGAFTTGWNTNALNLGAGVATITPTTSTILGRASFALRKWDAVTYVSDGVDYQALLYPGSLFNHTANNLIVGGGVGTSPTSVTPGTGVLTALQVNVGSAGAPVLFNGALGTPSSGTLTNATGLPIAGIASLGTGVATALAANVTGSGAIVLATGASLTGTTIQMGGPLTFSANGTYDIGTGTAATAACNSSPLCPRSIYLTANVLAGNIISSPYIRADDAGAFYFTNRAAILSPADSQFNFRNNAWTTGVGLDFATNEVLKIRTTAQSAYATIDVLGLRASGVSGASCALVAAVTALTVVNGIVTVCTGS